MIHKARRFSIAFTVAIVLALSIVAIAAAITIVVDGIKEPTRCLEPCWIQTRPLLTIVMILR